VLADVGLFHALARTPAADRFPRLESLTAELRGQLADQLAGQQLRLIDSGTGDGPELFFWKREGGRPGEVDDVVQIGGRIVPVELKAGAAGSMKSLHQFMFGNMARRPSSLTLLLAPVSVAVAPGRRPP
jgi:hypothetical protein